MLKITNI